MALDALTRLTIRRLADLVGQFAEARGWPREKFRLFFRVSESWNVLDFVLAVDENDSAERKQIWLELWTLLTEESRVRASGPFATVGLVVRSFEEMAEGGIYRLSSSFEEIEFGGDQGSPTSSSLASSTI